MNKQKGSGSPARELYRWLAESWHYTTATRQLHKGMGSRIPQRLGQIELELEGLRQRLSEIGVGTDLRLEDRYLELLQERRHLQQIWNNGQRLDPPHPIREEGLRKALRYGELLLAVYGGSRLSKSASQDIEIWVKRLGDRVRVLVRVTDGLRIPALSALGTHVLMPRPNGMQGRRAEQTGHWLTPMTGS